MDPLPHPVRITLLTASIDDAIEEASHREGDATVK